MHWIRIDRYYEGKPDNPHTYFQPVPCMQCENAPCEIVCPVGATVHSREGLNDMVYNRCVGTRYCSNNCPYKVRRFNFLLYSDWDTPQPEVPAQSGCDGAQPRRDGEVHLLRAAHQPRPRSRPKKQDRKVRDGEIVDGLPAGLSVGSHFVRRSERSEQPGFEAEGSQRNYGLLEELNTRPRTTYLAAVRNPNPELES